MAVLPETLQTTDDRELKLNAVSPDELVAERGTVKPDANVTGEVAEPEMIWFAGKIVIACVPPGQKADE